MNCIIYFIPMLDWLYNFSWNGVYNNEKETMWCNMYEYRCTFENWMYHVASHDALAFSGRWLPFVDSSKHIIWLSSQQNYWTTSIAFTNFVHDWKMDLWPQNLMLCNHIFLVWGGLLFGFLPYICLWWFMAVIEKISTSWPNFSSSYNLR